MSFHVNPYYQSYMHAHGVSCPDQMLALDRIRAPGGHMARFLAWNTEQWCAFFRDTKTQDTPMNRHLLAPKYHAWLESRFPAREGGAS